LARVTAPLVANLLSDAEVVGGGCVEADAEVPVFVVVVGDERVEPLAGVGQGIEPFGSAPPPPTVGSLPPLDAASRN